jgi:hypothetical protein
MFTMCDVENLLQLLPQQTDISKGEVQQTVSSTLPIR